MEAEVVVKRKRKPGGGRKKIWKEPTKTLGIVVPVSKVDSFMKSVRRIKRTWLNEIQKTA